MLLSRTAALVGFGLLAATSLGHAQRGGDGSPFAGLAGSWSGTGSVTLSNGSNERIRCRASYDVAPSGNMLRQSLRCASDSFTFDLGSQVTYQGGSISGTWRETSRNASGTLAGTVSRGEIEARVDGPSFQAGLAVSTRGDRQAISIRSQGTELTGASITLTRSR